MSTEQFFRGPDGKLTFNAVEKVGIDIAVDCNKIHQRVAQHFYVGDGWPVGRPAESEQVEIWNVFKTSASN